MHIHTAKQALEYLKTAGSVPECDLNVYHCALAFSRLMHDKIDLPALMEAEDQLLTAVKIRFEAALAEGYTDDLNLRCNVLTAAIHEDLKYTGDDDGYDEPHSADMTSVIERRRGLPVALGILYIQVAREMNWDIIGLNFPGHFLVRMTVDGEAAILDPFRNGKQLEAADLREILKAIAGQKAELSHTYYEPVTDHDVVFRLQNNWKKRFIDKSDYDSALIVIEGMRVFCPDEYRLLFDAALLKVKTGQVHAAEEDIRAFIAVAPTVREKQHGEQLLYEIQKALN